MIRLRDLSIRYKVVFSVAALVCAYSVFVVVYFPARQSEAIRAGIQQRARALAESVAFNAKPAVEFEDEVTARLSAEAAKVDPYVRYAQLLKPDGSVFAQYLRDQSVKIDPMPAGLNADTYEAGGLLHVVVQLGDNGQLGKVRVAISLEEEQVSRTRNVLAALAVAGVFLIVGVAVQWVVASWLVGPLATMTGVAQRIAAGDLEVELMASTANDEIGTLRRAFAAMVQRLQAISDHAQSVAKGDYHAVVDSKGDSDVLAIALNQMTGNLREVSERTERERWLRTGHAELSDRLRGEQNLIELARNIVTYLCHYLGAQVGAFYLADRTTKTLRLAASYAYTRRKNAESTISYGDGVVGQSALEGVPILLTEVPENYVSIQSGLGASPPRHILVSPFAFEKQTRGVVELGFLGPVDDRAIELLTAAGENVGIAVNSSQDRERMTELLKETQAQSEELRTQQAALTNMNDALQEQTKILKGSEEELKQQSEELQAANEELEEKTQYLQTQKLRLEQAAHEMEQARADLQKQAEELAQASKYKSEFLSNMSHELRTPLNSLLILSKSLADNDEGNLTDDQVESARIIYTGGMDLLDIINDVLDLSKVEAGKLDVFFEDVTLDSVIEKTKRQFAPYATDKGLDLIFDVDTAMPRSITTDPQRIQQIIKNLFSNAIKFTKKGSITLKITKGVDLSCLAAKIRSPHLTADNTAAFAVIDTGLGIPKHKQEAIFEAFRQADGTTARQFGGTGLGLTISRQLAALLGGEIHVASDEGKGSTFTLYLPLEGPPPGHAQHHGASAAPQLPAPAAAAVAAPTTGGLALPSTSQPQDGTLQAHLGRDARPGVIDDDRGRLGTGESTVLIIEDDVGYSNTLVGLARKRGYKCIAATTGHGGLQAAVELQPNGIILDIGLPDIDGLTVLDQLKYDLRTRHIPVHIISARDRDPLFMQHGAVGYLQKPATVEDVEDAFGRMDGFNKSGRRQVLLVEDDDSERFAVSKLISSDIVTVVGAGTVADALKELKTKKYDCVILDLRLPDGSGFDLLRAAEELGLSLPPVVVYSGKELTREEYAELTVLSASVVVKGAASPERLVDEISLFLHTVESAMPEPQRKALRLLHDPASVLEGKKVLLVDDDPRNTHALSAVLRKAGLVVVTAENGQVALDTLARQPDINIVLMDIMMPVMDGFEAMAMIRKNDRLKKVPILALTAKAMRDDREKCIAAGANDYLTKPVDVPKLLSMMRIWLFGNES